jgi:hypothetical protein
VARTSGHVALWGTPEERILLCPLEIILAAENVVFHHELHILTNTNIDSTINNNKIIIICVSGMCF